MSDDERANAFQKEIVRHGVGRRKTDMKHLDKPKVFPRDILAILVLLIAACACLYLYSAKSWGADLTKEEAAQLDGMYPDKELTPGATVQVTLKELCTPGYTSKVRNVPESVKRAVFEEYGIPLKDRGLYEVDHEISLELGGSNDIKNLWPERWLPNPGAHSKDQVENYLHRQVCKEGLPLAEAQREISTDWMAVWREIR